MKKMYITRKEKIIFSIIDLIDEIGIKELSIKEIAKKENITEAALYKHFESKEQMLIEVLDYYSRYDRNINLTLANSSDTEKEKIRKYFKLYSEYYDSYPAVTAIIDCYNILIHEKNIAPKIIEIYSNRKNFIEQLIKDGQDKGNINNNIKSNNLTCILLGTFQRAIFSWRLNGFKFSLKEKTTELIDDILKVYL